MFWIFVVTGDKRVNFLPPQACFIYAFSLHTLEGKALLGCAAFCLVRRGNHKLFG